MSVSIKRRIPTDEEAESLVTLLTQEELEDTIDWWVLYSKSRAEERMPAFKNIPSSFLEKYKTIFGKSLMESKTKRSDAIAAITKVLKYIQLHPERISMRIYDLCKNETKLYWIVSLVSRSQDDRGNVTLVPSSQSKTIGNLLDAETAINLQNIGLAKLKMIIDAISPELVKMANLGTLSKAGRDIIAMLHVMSLDYKPDQELIREYKETKDADGKTKRESITRFIEKNRKSWNGG